VDIIGVVVEVTEGSKEGKLLGFMLHILERLIVESLLRLVLARFVVVLVLALAGVVLVERVLVLLGAVGDKVVRVSTSKASILWTTTSLVVQAVVVKP